MSDSIASRSIRIEKSAVGNAIVSGDGNTIYVVQQTTEQQSQPAEADAPTKIGPNPYKGLAAFKESDADRYFGREVQIERLWRQFQALHEQSSRANRAPRFLPILGPSGCGKSSLARAGLIPELARRPLPEKEQMRIVVMTPGESPLKAMAGGLAKLTQDDQTPEVIKKRSYEAELRKSAESGRFDFLQDVAELLPDIQAAPLVVLIDQFEEIYSLCKDAAERKCFVENLLYAAKSVTGYITVVITLRSDFLGETQRHPGLNQAIGGADYNPVVQAMTPDELRRAIAEPAKQAGHPFDAATIDLLVKDAEGREGALPLLQFALTRIWEGLSEGRPPAETYRQMGGVGGALAGKAQEIYDQLTHSEQAIAQRIFVGLVQLGEGMRDTRRRATVKSFVANQDTLEAVNQVIERFSAPGARLVTRSNEADQEISEVTHEALFGQWSLLNSWLDGSRDDIRFQRRLEAAASYWDSQKRPGGLLWRSPDLDLLRHYQRRLGQSMTALQLDFFYASGRAATRQRVLGWFGVGVLTTLTAGMTWFAIQSRREAEISLARQLAAQSEQLLSQPQLTQQETGALLAVEAFQPIERWREDSVLVDQALRHSLKIRLPMATFKPDASVEAMIFSRDGQTVVTASRDGTVQLWDIASGEARAMLDHGSSVETATFSRDGQTVAMVDYETLRLWDIDSGEIRATLNPDSQVDAVTFSHDGQTIATTDSDFGIVQVWDIPSGEVIAVLNHDVPVETVVFSRDGQTVATVNKYGGGAWLWDVASGEVRTPLSHADEVLIYAVAFSRDGQTVVTGSRDGIARLWDVDSGEVSATLNHGTAVGVVAFSRDGQTVATASWDGIVRLWDVASGEVGATFNHGAAVGVATFSDDGQTLLTAGGSASLDGAVRLWDVANGEAKATFNHDAPTPLRAVSFSNDGQIVATTDVFGTVRLWNVASREVRAILKHKEVVLAVTFSDDGQTVATASGDWTARLWDAASGEAKATLKNNGRVNAAAFSRDSQTVATASANGAAQLWDAVSGQAIATLNHGGRVEAVSFSGDGQTVATASSDGTARLWDVASGEARVTLNHDDNVLAVSFSDDGQTVATASADGTARLWDATSGQAIATLNHESTVMTVTFSRDSQTVATASADGTARLWDAASGEARVTLNHDDTVWAVSFNDDGQTVATASSDGTARLWDAGSGKAEATLHHEDGVLAVAFSGDGQTVATGSQDKTARLWDAKSGKAIAVINHDDMVLAVAFSGDGQTLATASRGGAGRLIWRWPRDLVDQICSRVSRNLTVDQWKRYIQPDLLEVDLTKYEKTCPNLPVHPTVIEQAQRIAEQGEVKEAIAILRRVLKLKTTPDEAIDLDLSTPDEVEQDPKAVALKFSAVSIVKEAEGRAKVGKLEESISLYQQALSLNPEIDLNPSTSDEVEQDPETVVNAIVQSLEKD